MAELCQCPFCGSAPRVYQTEYRIMCSSQSCPVRPSVFSNDLNVAEVRWNSRPDLCKNCGGKCTAEGACCYNCAESVDTEAGEVAADVD